MLCELLTTSLSKSEFQTREFYDRWIGEAGLLSALGRLIFRLSGVVYSGSFIRAACLTADHSILEIGCGMGRILTTTHNRLGSIAPYVGVDLSFQMVAQAFPSASDNRHCRRVSL